MENLAEHIVIFKERNPYTQTGQLSMTMRALFDLYAKDMGYVPSSSNGFDREKLIKKFYDEDMNREEIADYICQEFKQTSGLEKLDGDKVLKTLWECIPKDTYFFEDDLQRMTEAICSKFGTPSVPSIEVMANAIVLYALENKVDELKPFNYKSFTAAATAIRNLLLKKEK